MLIEYQNESSGKTPYFPQSKKEAKSFLEFQLYAFSVLSRLERQIFCLSIMDQEMSQDETERKTELLQMYERGELTLEAIAIENKPDAVEIIDSLILAGMNPLEPNSKKLFPYHYSKCLDVYGALTPPPIQRESFLLTLAR